MAAINKDPTLLWALFGFDGRVNREVFWLGNFGTAFVAIAFTTSVDPETGLIQFSPFAFFAFVLLAWSEIALGVKRLHDRGLSGWFALSFAVPLVGILAVLIIGFMPGDRGANMYAAATNQRGP